MESNDTVADVLKEAAEAAVRLNQSKDNPFGANMSEGLLALLVLELRKLRQELASRRS